MGSPKTSNQQKLKDRIAIVTGGGKGIGRSIALAFAEEGASVAICGRHLPLLEEVSNEAREVGATIIPIKADVAEETEVENMVAQTLKTFGKIDILVNNAGTGGPLGLLTEISKAQWDEVININITGMFLCARAVLRDMIKRKSGNIINLSSGAGFRWGKVGKPLPYRLGYSVSKFAIEGFTYALATQMKPYGICVNALRPGAMDTDIHKGSPAEWYVGMRKPDEVKPFAVFMALQTADTMTGESIDLKEWLTGTHRRSPLR